MRPRLVRGDHALHHRFDQRRRLRLLAPQLVEAVAELLVHLAERLDQDVDRRECRSGGSGAGRPRRWPGRAAAISVSGRAIERAGHQREHGADQERQQRGARHRPLRPAHDLVHLRRGRPPPAPRPGPPGTATYRAARPTVSLRRRGHADAAARAPRAPRDGWHGSRSAGSGPGGKSLSARTRPRAVDQRDAVAVLRRRAGAPPRSQPSESAGSASRIRRGLALERARDVALEVAPERALGGPEQDHARSSTRISTVPSTSRVAKLTARGLRARCPGSDSRSRAPSRSSRPASPSLVRSRCTCMSTVRVWMSGCASQTVSSSWGRVCTRPRRSTSVSRSLYSVAVRLSSSPVDAGPVGRAVDGDRPGGEGRAGGHRRRAEPPEQRRAPGARAPAGRTAW